MLDTSQTIPELVSWAKEREFSLNLPTERLAFLLAIAIYNNERFEIGRASCRERVYVLV